MQKLSDLPASDAPMTPQERQVVGKYFAPGSSQPGGSTGSPQVNHPRPTLMQALKLVGYAVLLFLLLGNNWIDALLCRIPYCGGNALTLLGIKAILFALIFFILVKYVA